MPLIDQQGEQVVALKIAQEVLVAEVSHGREHLRILELRLSAIEENLQGREGIYTELALMREEHQTQRRQLERLGTRGWQIILALLGVLITQGVQILWRVSPQTVHTPPPIVVPFNYPR